MQNFCNIPIPKFLLSLCLQQCIIENGEDDNGFMTNRNGANADAVGQSSFWEDNGFYEWLYWIARN